MLALTVWLVASTAGASAAKEPSVALVGPELSDTEARAWLARWSRGVEPMRARWVAFVDGFPRFDARRRRVLFGVCPSSLASGRLAALRGLNGDIVAHELLEPSPESCPQLLLADDLKECDDAYAVEAAAGALQACPVGEHLWVALQGEKRELLDVWVPPRLDGSQGRAPRCRSRRIAPLGAMRVEQHCEWAAAGCTHLTRTVFDVFGSGRQLKGRSVESRDQVLGCGS